MYMDIMPACISVYRFHAWLPEGQKMASDHPLELLLQTVVSYHVGAEN